MISGVTFGNKNSKTDWNLFLKNKPFPSPPTPRTTYVDIPEADGQLDLSESLTGDIHYMMREIRFEFLVINARQRWDTLYSEIQNYLHGKQMKIILDSDKSWYYIGRLSVNTMESDQKTATLVIDAKVQPYKQEIIESSDDWLWDPFHFPTGVIMVYKNISVEGTKTIKVVNSRQKVVPEIIVSDMTSDTFNVAYNGVTYSLQSGSNLLASLILTEGENTLLFTGTATIKIRYRRGSL